MLHHHMRGCQETKHHAILRCMGGPINLKLSKRIKELRKKAGMTQEQLAESIKTSYKYIQRIEGKTPPDIRLSTVEKIAKALKASLSDLLKL